MQYYIINLQKHVFLLYLCIFLCVYSLQQRSVGKFYGRMPVANETDLPPPVVGTKQIRKLSNKKKI